VPVLSSSGYMRAHGPRMRVSSRFIAASWLEGSSRYARWNAAFASPSRPTLR
jgi:hypothetical protein